MTGYLAHDMINNRQERVLRLGTGDDISEWHITEDENLFTQHYNYSKQEYHVVRSILRTNIEIQLGKFWVIYDDLDI